MFAQTDQRLQTLSVEECRCCDVEILNVKPPLNQTSLRRDPELANMLCIPGTESGSSSVPASCEPVQADYRPQSAIVLWDRLALQPMMSITNKSYLSTVEENEERWEISSSSEPSTCLEESCAAIYGYISENA